MELNSEKRLRMKVRCSLDPSKDTLANRTSSKCAYAKGNDENVIDESLEGLRSITKASKSRKGVLITVSGMSSGFTGI